MRLPHYALEELNPEPNRTVGAGLPANNGYHGWLAGMPAPTKRTVPPRFVTAQRGEMLAMTAIFCLSRCHFTPTTNG